MKVDYLRAVVQFHDNPENNVFKLEGGVEWGKSIAPLKEVIKFEDEEAYVPPDDEKLYF